MKIKRPAKEDYPEYYEQYIALVPDENPVRLLKDGKKKMTKLLSALKKKQLDFRYAEGKWSVKEVLLHLMDAERIFAYRALRFARNDKTSLPGFEENEYAPESFAAERKLKSLLNEFEAIRNQTIEEFSNFNEDQLSRSGTANKNKISVRSILFIIVGHQMHHMNVIKERYLNAKGKKKTIEQPVKKATKKKQSKETEATAS